jgi:hypothetical protein
MGNQTRAAIPANTPTPNTNRLPMNNPVELLMKKRTEPVTVPSAIPIIGAMRGDNMAPKINNGWEFSKNPTAITAPPRREKRKKSNEGDARWATLSRKSVRSSDSIGARSRRARRLLAGGKLSGSSGVILELN